MTWRRRTIIWAPCIRPRPRIGKPSPSCSRRPRSSPETMGTDHPRYAATLFNLSLVQTKIGRWQEAEDNCRQAATIWQAAYGRQHPRTVAARGQLAYQLRKNGRYEESLRIYLALLHARGETAEVDDPEVRRLRKAVATVQGLLGDFAAAEPSLRRGPGLLPRKPRRRSSLDDCNAFKAGVVGLAARRPRRSRSRLSSGARGASSGRWPRAQLDGLASPLPGPGHC